MDFFKNSGNMLISRNDKFTIITYDNIFFLYDETFILFSTKLFDKFIIFTKNKIHVNYDGNVNIMNFYDNYSTSYYYNATNKKTTFINKNIFTYTFTNDRDTIKYLNVKNGSKTSSIFTKRNFICIEYADPETKYIKSYTNDLLFHMCPKTPSDYQALELNPNTGIYESTLSLKGQDITIPQKAKTIMKLGNKIITPNDNKLNDILICYKLCKNSKNENRIVKLGIPVDGKIVKTIDEEYFMNCEKERANSAIILDIQLPDLDNEISVVPKEISCFSCVYNKKLEYKVGKMVYPDNFCEDDSLGCAEGIHFHRNRRAVFKRWINGYEEIEL